MFATDLFVCCQILQLWQELYRQIVVWKRFVHWDFLLSYGPTYEVPLMYDFHLAQLHFKVKDSPMEVCCGTTDCHLLTCPLPHTEEVQIIVPLLYSIIGIHWLSQTLQRDK